MKGCKLCKKEYPAGNNFCKVCGSKLDELIHCNCGEILDVDANFCTKCGKKIIVEQGLVQVFEVPRPKEEDLNQEALYAQGYKLMEERSFDEGVRLLNKSAKMGFLPAQVVLGVCYKYGIGVVTDIEIAFQTFKQTAEGGNPLGQLNYAMLLESGRGTKVDKTNAIYWYQQAANQGLPEAIVYLGNMYHEHGENKKAFEFYLKASEMGDAMAQYDLARCYEEGVGVDVDECKAFYWMYKAAEQHVDPHPYIGIGLYYLQGTGVSADKTQAKYWLKLAADCGLDLAKDYLDKYC